MTCFIDSSKNIGPFMHSKRLGYTFSPNLMFLGRSGVYDFRGLKIGYLSGIDGSKNIKNEQLLKTPESYYSGNEFTQNDIQTIIDQCNNIHLDILLTNEWPMNIFSHIKQPFETSDTYQYMSLKIADLINKVCPRYHFCSQDRYYQRLPYTNQKGYFSRIICLAGIPTSTTAIKEKYMHALMLTPASQMKKEELYDITGEHTLNPFLSLDDFLLEVGPTAQKNKKTEYVNDTSAIYIGNLDYKVTEEMLKEFLSKWGKVQSLSFILDPVKRIIGLLKNSKGMHSLHLKTQSSIKTQ